MLKAFQAIRAQLQNDDASEDVVEEVVHRKARGGRQRGRAGPSQGPDVETKGDEAPHKGRGRQRRRRTTGIPMLDALSDMSD